MSMYFDHNATTPLAPEVWRAMEPFLRGDFANASALYARGRRAREVVEAAREQVGRLIGAAATEIVFTSGGTEANNLALRGVMEYEAGAGHLVVPTLEHASVLRCAAALEEAGHAVTRVPPGPDGAMDPGQLCAAVTPRTRLVSLMLASNVTGVVQPVPAVGRALADREGIVVHCDAVQAGGRIPIDVDALRVDLLTLSAHKLHGPQGIGALYLRRGTRVRPLISGGGQEGGLRPGTQNVAAIAGFGEAARLARLELDTRSAYVEDLRQRFEDGLRRRGVNAVIVGARAPRLPNTSLVCFPGKEGGALAANLDQRGFAVSTGSACDSGKSGPSHALEGMGLGADVMAGALRFSLGPDNTPEEIGALVGSLVELVGGPSGRPSMTGLLGKAISTRRS
ncbi:MAG: cysteine desulfurase family protein [Pseudomonadota bacterium]